jgi:hypothetical protein
MLSLMRPSLAPHDLSVSITPSLISSIRIPNGAHDTHAIHSSLPRDHRLDRRICVVLNRGVTAHLRNLVSCTSIVTG